jgi:murein DD-endopeptidase MepM/ murein hydrolase activator NlpD
VFVFFGLGALLLIFVTSYILAFTPLREYIPGYGDAGIRRDMVSLSQRVDSLEEETRKKDRFLQNIKNVISGKETPPDTVITKKKGVDYSNLDFTRSGADSTLRQEVESHDHGGPVSFSENAMSLSGVYFYKPVSGVMTSKFNPAIRHYGVDLAAPEKEPVKAVLDGTVISIGWNIENGQTIQIQHGGNMVSVYKHNSAVLKKEGEKVRAGEAIALVGNTGENSTGPHVHFELWFNGSAVNPADYINF